MSADERSKMLAEAKKNEAGSSEAIKMKKEIGLIEGVAIILGIIIGSGQYL